MEITIGGNVTPMVTTTAPTLATVIERARVDQLPLNSRMVCTSSDICLDVFGLVRFGCGARQSSHPPDNSLTLADEENFSGLARINRELVGKLEALNPRQRVVLDMDSTEIPVYGEQENSAYNGHFEFAITRWCC